MAVEKKTEFVIDHYYDPIKCRHYLNGVCTVLHCHHYATLYTQLAHDASDFEGERLMVEAAEDSFYESLKSYFTQKGIESLDDKIELAQQYWQVVGMGLIRFVTIGPYSITAEMEYSHLDEGWLKKWGGNDEPINFFTQGYVAAVAALFLDKPVRSFKVRETQSLVVGDDKSVLKAIAV